MERLKPEKILVLAPNWVGDAVMATPALAALAARFSDAEITTAARPYVLPVFDGLPEAGRLCGLAGLERRAPWRYFLSDALALRKEHFDLAVIFPNSARSALFAFLAGAGERLGYRRDGRGLLLTRSLEPPREGSRFRPVPMVDYYLELVGLLGARPAGRRLRMAVTDSEREEADAALEGARVDFSRPWAVINPGAAFGSAKCWLPENFAAVADALSQRGLEVLLVTGPKERDIGGAINTAASAPIAPLWREGVGLGALKSIVERAAVLVTNDSGPRHFAAAFSVPVVTIMGPTDPRWSDTGYERETVVRKEVECGPCMLRVCPLDHRCMKLVTPEEVIRAADELLLPGGEGGVSQ